MVDRDLVLGRLREICLALPETSERLSHGAPSFFIRGKTCFLMLLDDHHGDGRFAIWCAAPAGDQQLLVDADAEKFFVPPYVGHRGWLGVRLDRGLEMLPQRRRLLELAAQPAEEADLSGFHMGGDGIEPPTPCL